MATAKFVERFDSLYNVFNTNGGKSKAPFKHPIITSSFHIGFLKETLKWFRLLHCGTKEKKPADCLSCARGWQQTIWALLMLVNNTITGDIKFLPTNRFNHDCVANLFAFIRGKVGYSDNPHLQEFRTALRQVMVDKILIINPGTNCKHDFDTLLLVLPSRPNQFRIHFCFHLQMRSYKKTSKLST